MTLDTSESSDDTVSTASSAQPTSQYVDDEEDDEEYYCRMLVNLNRCRKGAKKQKIANRALRIKIGKSGS